MRKSVFVFTISVLLTILILSLTFAIANAQTAEELLKTPGLTADQRAAIAEAIAKKGTSPTLPEQIKGMLEWREMGEAFALTIEKICQTLNVEVNKFLSSDVGMLTAGVIIYKMIGKDILRIVLYTGIWLGVTFFMMISIKFLHMKKLCSIKGEDGVISVQPVDRFGWDNDVIKNVSLVFHMTAWFIFTCIIAANVI